MRAYQMHDMTTYTIIPNSDGSGFNISVASSNGTRQTMLGFNSEEEAETWICQDKRLSDVPASYMSAESASAQG